MKHSMYFFFFLTLISFKSNASEPFIPNSDDFIVAEWTTSTTQLALNEQLAQLLSQAVYPGNSANYSIAANLLKKAKVNELSQVQRLYFEAVIKQHYHRFEESKDLLLALLQKDPAHVNAILLLSNIHSVLGEAEQATKMCVRLLLTTDQTLVAVCALNAKAQDGQLSESVKQLSSLLKGKMPENKELAIWIAEVHASLVKSNGNARLADQLLTPFLDLQLPLSFWVLWSDIQLELDKPQNIIERVQPVVQATNNEDDALILKLAIAEQKTGATTREWRDKARARVNLRESRNDMEHAFDIALYYFHIEQNYELAHQWALINWEQAKLLEDKELLSKTEKMMQSTLVFNAQQGVHND